MKNRRDFLKTAALAVAGGLVAPGLLSSCGGGGAKKTAKTTKNIGLQLYSLRAMEKEMGIEAVLKAVAEMGYTRLETANYSDGKFYGKTPAELKKMTDDLGMKITSSHVGQAYNAEKIDEIMDWWKRATDAHNELGVKYMVQPWMSVTDDTTLDEIKTICDYFSNIGIVTAANGINFGYHNHDFEFKRKYDDVPLYDHLLNGVSKNHVLFQLDVYWCQVGGYSPVDYMKKYPSQITILHIKDEKEIGASGQMDFKPIFEQAQATNITDWYVEVEQYTNNNPQESVKQSFDYLNAADYVK